MQWWYLFQLINPWHICRWLQMLTIIPLHGPLQLVTRGLNSIFSWYAKYFLLFYWIILLTCIILMLFFNWCAVNNVKRFSFATDVPKLVSLSRLQCCRMGTTILWKTSSVDHSVNKILSEIIDCNWVAYVLSQNCLITYAISYFSIHIYLFIHKFWFSRT